MSDSLDSSEQAENSCRVVESGTNRAHCKDACVQSSANKILDLYTYCKKTINPEALIASIELKYK